MILFTRGLLVILFPFEGHKSKPSICTIRIVASIVVFHTTGAGSNPAWCLKDSHSNIKIGKELVFVY